MAEFKEELVINALHPEKAEVGKKYWFADDIVELKERVETNKFKTRDVLDCIGSDKNVPFHKKDICFYRLLYPYEEPKEQRMTNFQLEEWLAKGYGLWKSEGKENPVISSVFEYYLKDENEEVSVLYRIRPFGQTEWQEPTVDIYERDCKGGKE